MKTHRITLSLAAVLAALALGFTGCSKGTRSNSDRYNDQTSSTDNTSATSSMTTSTANSTAVGNATTSGTESTNAMSTSTASTSPSK